MAFLRKPTARIAIFFLLAIGLINGCTQPSSSPTPAIQVTNTALPAPSATPFPATSTSAPTATETALTQAATFTSIPPTASLVTPGVTQSSLMISPLNASSLQRIAQVNQPGALSFTWASGKISVVTDKEITLYKDKPPVEYGQLNAPGTTTTIASPDGSLLASTGEDNIVHVWDLTTDKEVASLKGHSGPVTGLAFSPDGKVLVTSSYDKSVRQWDPRSGKQLNTWTYSYWPSTVQFSPDGKWLAGTELEKFTVHIWDASNGKEQRSLSWTETASPALYSAIFSPDWKTLAWTARGTVQLMDVESGNLGQTLSHEDFVSATSWSPDGRLIATASAATVNGNFSPVVVIWDTGTGKPVNTLVQSDAVVGLGFSTDGLSLVTLVNKGVISLWAVKK